MKLSFASPTLPKSGVAVVFATDGGKLISSAATLDSALKGTVSKAVKAANFVGKKEQWLDVLVPGGGLDRIVVMGLGEVAKLTPKDVELLGGALAGAISGLKVSAAAVLVDGLEKAAEHAAVLLASGAALRDYAFDSYKSKKGDKTEIATLTFLVKDADKARKAFAAYDAIREGNHLARNLVNEPSNVLNPTSFAARAKALSKHGVKVEVLGPKQMEKLGMHALLGVARGSQHDAQMVIMRWDGGKKGEQPLAFIGKGVTFDTGGVSIKPAAGMEDMKGDMAGAACVTGLMLALAKRKAKVNVIGAIGLVENVVDGKAQRPGDVVKSMSGQTIAVLNTDAEGRLVLADVLWYIQDRFKPKFMINLATLTGAILVALGKEHAGLFSNNDELSQRLHTIGEETGERVWRLPLLPEYDKLIDHDVADVKNIGGRFAGSITAAQFLQRFVNKVPWVHLDVAGTAMDSVKTSINQSWASGWGVRLLNRLVEKHYEK
jgi:leucyl aminopeptidase